MQRLFGTKQLAVLREAFFADCFGMMPMPPDIQYADDPTTAQYLTHAIIGNDPRIAALVAQNEIGISTGIIADVRRLESDVGLENVPGGWLPYCRVRLGAPNARFALRRENDGSFHIAAIRKIDKDRIRLIGTFEPVADPDNTAIALLRTALLAELTQTPYDAAAYVVGGFGRNSKSPPR